MKILVLVNTLQAVNSFIYSNHIEFFVKSVKTDSTIQFVLFTPSRMSIDSARNNAAKYAMQNECDYLMFIDDDVMIPNNSLELLLKADKDIIAALVIIRGMPFNVMAFKAPDPLSLTYYNDLPLLEPCKEGHLNFEISCDACHLTPLQELISVDAVGFSCCLIKVDVLHAMYPPYFVTGSNHTEDIYFCMKAKELAPAPTIFMHTGLQCGHLLNSEPIEWSTRRRFQKFYNSEEDLSVKPYTRDNEHIKKCLNNL